MTDPLTLTRPDDWHVHLRDGDALTAVVPHTAAQFARAIVMPNLKPPVTTTEIAMSYRDRIVAALPAGSDFQPLMTLYLTAAGAEFKRTRSILARPPQMRRTDASRPTSKSNGRADPSSR